MRLLRVSLATGTESRCGCFERGNREALLLASGRVRELPGMGSAPANRGHRARVLYPPHVREKTLGLGAFLRGIGAGKSPRARDKTRRAPRKQE